MINVKYLVRELQVKALSRYVYHIIDHPIEQGIVLKGSQLAMYLVTFIRTGDCLLNFFYATYSNFLLSN